MYLTQFLPQFKFCIISIQGLLYNLWVLVQNEDVGPQLGWESQCPLPTGLPLQSIVDWWLKGIAAFSLESLTTWMRVGERSLLKHLLIVECCCQPRCGTATALPAPCSTCSIPSHPASVPRSPMRKEGSSGTGTSLQRSPPVEGGSSHIAGCIEGKGESRGSRWKAMQIPGRHEVGGGTVPGWGSKHPENALLPLRHHLLNKFKDKIIMNIKITTTNH